MRYILSKSHTLVMTSWAYILGKKVDIKHLIETMMTVMKHRISPRESVTGRHNIIWDSKKAPHDGIFVILVGADEAKGESGKKLGDGQGTDIGKLGSI